jgi:hypothetical protein
VIGSQSGRLVFGGVFPAFPVEFFLGGEDRGVMSAAIFDEVVDNAGQFVSGGGDGFGVTRRAFMQRT